MIFSLLKKLRKIKDKGRKRPDFYAFHRQGSSWILSISQSKLFSGLRMKKTCCACSLLERFLKLPLLLIVSRKKVNRLVGNRSLELCASKLVDA